MKKILCIILALVCAFSIVSCGDDEPEVTLEEVVAQSSPTKVVTHVTYKFGEEHVLANENLGGRYTLEIEGANSIFSYDYNRLATPEENNEGVIKNIKGKIYAKDGKFSSDGEVWDNGLASNMEVKFNLLASQFVTYEKSEDEKTLTATITGDNVENVMGFKISADGNVNMQVFTNGTYLTRITLTYKSLQGANVTVDTSYTYNDIRLEFPSADAE